MLKIYRFPRARNLTQADNICERGKEETLEIFHILFVLNS
jgi:hypothetical protein